MWDGSEFQVVGAVREKIRLASTVYPWNDQQQGVAYARRCASTTLSKY